MTLSEPALECQQVEVGFARQSVLEDLTFRIHQGEVVALLGANGAGKSTLVKAALGLVPLRRGQIHLLGTPLSRFRASRRVGYVPQRLGAESGVPATVREVVSSGRLARRGMLRWPHKADRNAVITAMDTVDIGDLARRSVGTLSGGQQQRVLIARALAGEPELLLLDEPTAGIDASSQRAFHEALATLKQRGVTIVLVAHELGLLAPLITRVLVLAGGGIAFDGPATAAAADQIACNDIAHRLAHVADHPHATATTNLWGS